MKYLYTATFTPMEDGTGYYCRVPDLPSCITTGRDLNDAIEMITDAASGWLLVAEDDGQDPIPATPQADVPHGPNDVLSMIAVDTGLYRARLNGHAVRKSVSLPLWMAELVERNGINCSQVLQEALRTRLA